MTPFTYFLGMVGVYLLGNVLGQAQGKATYRDSIPVLRAQYIGKTKLVDGDKPYQGRLSSKRPNQALLKRAIKAYTFYDTHQDEELSHTKEFYL